MRRIVLAFIMTAITLLGSFGGTGVSAESLDPAMIALWDRTDRPVANHEVDRSWLWGPQANQILHEPYTYEPLDDNQRLVAYFDKSRMEINDPTGDPDDVWYVTNGRLVYEMMTGRVQVGQEPDQYTVGLPAALPAAGDPYSYSTPTYQALGRLLGSADDHTGEQVTATVDAFGNVGANLSPVADLEQAAYVTHQGSDGGTVGHNVPDVFWDFLDHQVSPLVEPADWRFVTGYPLTEAYWTRSFVNGNETNVLLQCFERRCLTYTPGNDAPYKVEMGNVGQHYYAWRHQGWSISCPTVPVRGFGALWSDNDSVRSRIGCPEMYAGGEQGTETAYQPFEHGMMIWTNVQDYYNPAKSVLVLYDDGSFERFEDTWSEGQPVEDPNMVAPENLYEPMYGFGQIWRDVPGLRDRLGWATEPEQGSGGAYQRFNFGTMLWVEDFDKIWVFYGDLYWNNNGNWEVYDDTFEG